MGIHKTKHNYFFMAPSPQFTCIKALISLSSFPNCAFLENFLTGPFCIHKKWHVHIKKYTYNL